MAKMTAGERRHLDKSKFALPGKKMFPIQNRSHAEAALMDVDAAVHHGSITSSEAATVRRKAEAELHRSK